MSMRITLGQVFQQGVMRHQLRELRELLGIYMSRLACYPLNKALIS
jgi:hypothetical protein